MTWLPDALKYIGSGVAGAMLTYGLTWLRERRRTLDSYRAPQRQGISEILTATHAFMMCELEKRTRMMEMVEQIRRVPQQEDLGVPGEQLEAGMRAMGEKVMAAENAMSSALLGVERAFAVGTLTVVDPPCWEAMGAAYFQFDQLRSAIKDGATEKETLEEVEQYIGTIAGHASQLNRAVSALVRAAQYRVSPAGPFLTPWRRRRAKRRLGQLHQQVHAADTSGGAPQAHV